jgi:hypothetical protein
LKYRNSDQKEGLSILGFGCMRFPKTAGKIDMEKTEKMLIHAIESGINYFDTAYVYPGSEAALGIILEKNKCRHKINIATKLPHYLVKKEGDFEKYFQEALSRLKTDTIDYYLMHMLPDTKVWQKLIDFGVLEWIEEKKKSGEIKYIGFSYHGNTKNFIDVLEAYPWEFCQIQYNYMDEHSQAGRKGLMKAYEKNIPVIIMEPLRGGLLVNKLPKKAEKLFVESSYNRSPAEWAFRWLYHQKEVSVVLSGMQNMDMLEENISVASATKEGMWISEEEEFIQSIKEILNAKTKVGCTACNYCMPCPYGVDIPGNFRAYNVSYTDGYFKGIMEYALCTTMRSNQSFASKCVECGVCVPHCPQAIMIPSELKKVKRRFENPLFKIGSRFIRKRYE